MNKIKKSALLLLLASSLLFSGCDVISAQEYEESENISADFGAANSEGVAEETTGHIDNSAEIKTIEPPENGWTEELLGQVTYFCGKQISLPCEFNDLSFYDDLEIEESDIIEIPTDKVDYYYKLDGQLISTVKYYDVYYNEIMIASITCLINDDSEIVCDITEFNIDSGITNLLSINSVDVSNDLPEIIRKLGDKYHYKEDNYFYIYNCQSSNNAIIAFRYKNNKTKILEIGYCNYEK